MLTIEEKIARSERFAKLCGQAEISEWTEECEQLAEWLRELQERRKAPEIIRCCECDYWKSGMKYCTHPNGMNSDLDNGFCSMAKRRTE